MTTGLIWAIILGMVASIGLISLALWIVIRFPDRAPHDTVPAYTQRADAPALPMQREAPEDGGAPAQAAGLMGAASKVDG